MPSNIRIINFSQQDTYRNKTVNYFLSKINIKILKHLFITSKIETIIK